MNYVRTLLTLCVAVILLAENGLAQDEVVRVDTKLVSINVAVVDGDGKPVAGLTEDKFEIYDNRVKQEIEHFSNASAGVTFGIVYDMHPTTTQRTNSVLNGLRDFTKRLQPADEFFFVVFNERGSLSLDIVPDADQLQRHLASPANRQTRSLYDALYLAAEKLRVQKNQKRSLLVITDAADHGSRRSFNELREALGNFDVQVYAIMLDEKLDRFTSYVDVTKDQQRAQILSGASPSQRSALNSITLRSGGATFPSSLEDRQNILRISEQIADEMRRQYTLSFYPSQPSDGARHSVRVGLRGVSGSKKFVLTYRQAYQASAPTNR